MDVPSSIRATKNIYVAKKLKGSMLLEVATREGIYFPGIDKDIGRIVTIYQDTLCIPIGTFQHDIWKTEEGGKYFEALANHFNVSNVVVERDFPRGNLRLPNVDLVYGTSTIVTVRDNGIKYTWDMAQTMYSKGNITEKLRIANFNCANQIVVDMFAGIGYFTLPYLIHAKAAKVYAIDLNANALTSLQRNLSDNNVDPERYEIIHGDSREVTPAGFANHVNMGSFYNLDESDAFLLAGIKALCSDTGGILHFHQLAELSKQPIPQEYLEGVESKIKVIWNTAHNACVLETMRKMEKLLAIAKPNESWTLNVLEVFRIKTYSRFQDHIVIDIRVWNQHSQFGDSRLL